jgi:diguanylate cyclase (GGDEF)-like protein
MGSSTAAKSQPRSRRHRRQDTLSIIARLVADDLPLAGLFSRLATLLNHAVGPMYLELSVTSRESQVFKFGALPESNPGAGLTLPLRFHDQELGAIHIVRMSQSAFSADDVELLETCASYISIRLVNVELISEREHFEELAGVDPLTGVSSKREFDEQFEAEWKRGVRHGGHLSILMVDIDHFKAYNDRYGHVAGDACLRKIATILDTSAVRPGDTVARFGGDEFAIILAQTERSGAIQVAERLRMAAAAQRIENAGEPLGIVTVSVGVATEIPAQDSPSTTLLEEADKALYSAKSIGRNLVASEGYRTNASQTGQPPVRSNLPTRLSPFFGRAAELDAIDCLLDQTRTLTITGTAGIGKTRVALATASNRLAKYPDGVWFVDLARVTDAALVAGSVLFVVGDTEERGTQPLATLVDNIADKRVLLLLDNCHGLMEECAALTEALVRKCPHAQVVATCRDGLGVRGEISYRVPSIAVHDAADLFISRATSVLRSFAPTEEERSTIERIVTRLDGIPMAIELVAARIKVMTVGELDARLGERFPEQRAKTTSPRPHLLSTVVDWSYHLLDAAEQNLLRRLAVFPGDWSMAASADICSDRDVGKGATLDVLSRMVNKALLLSEGHEAGPRYSMFETLQEYCRQLMREYRELGGLQRRHSEYYRKVADHMDSERQDPVTEEWVGKIETEVHNFRAALEWSVLDGGDLESGASLAIALAPWWIATSHFREARYWIDHIIWRANDDTFSAELRERVLSAASLIGSQKTDAPQIGRNDAVSIRQ